MGIRVASGLRATYKNAVEMSVKETLDALPTRTNCYELLGDLNRVFLDIDGKRLPQEMSRQEWEQKRDATREAIEGTSGSEPYSLMDSSDYDKRIISFRVVYTKVKTTKASNKEFAARMRETMQLPEGVSVDTSPYGENQKIRMLGSSKDGEDRPFVLVHGDPVDTLISYVDDAEERVYVKEEDPRNPSPIVAVEQERLVSICKLIGTARWQDYGTCIRLIFALKSCGSTEEFIHEQCMRAPNYGRQWVDRTLRSWNADKTPTFGTLMYYARLDNPKELQCLIRDTEEIAVEELMKLDTHSSTEEELNWCDNGRWLHPLPLDDTLAVKSGLGTGKTRQTIDLCRRAEKPSLFSKAAATYKRILVVSVRKTFSDHILAEIDDFVDYRDIKSRSKDGEVNSDRALVSIQSLWRRGGEPEDMVVLDEIETILANLSPNTTHGKNYLKNVAALERIVRGAKRVVALDAFLTDRSLDFLKALRPSVRLLVNPSIAHKRTAVVFSDPAAYFTECDRRIKQGKKAYMFWGGREKGEGFHKLMQVPNQLYTGKSDQEIRKKHLSDVNTHWANLQVVGATSAISVGVNYTGSPAFDQVFAYVIPWAGGNGRDTMQSIWRVRELKDETMVFFIEPKPNMFIKGDMGLAHQQEEYGQTTERHRRFLKEIGENETQYTHLPQWLRDVIVWNRNEKLVNAHHLRAVCFAYMKRCGITIELDAREGDAFELERAQCPHHSQIDDIEYEQVETYERNQSVLTETQRLEMEKYYMMRKVEECSQEVWEQWLKNRRGVLNAWAIRNLTPTQWVQSASEKCIDLVPKDAEKLNVLLSLGIDFAQPWSRALTDLPELNMECFNLRKQGKKEGKSEDYRQLCRGVEGWASLHLNLTQTKKQVKGVRSFIYTLSYDPQDNPLQRAVRKKVTCAETFADTED